MSLLDANYAVFVEWVKLGTKKYLTETFKSDLQKTKQTNKQKTLETETLVRTLAEKTRISLELNYTSAQN